MDNFLHRGFTFSRVWWTYNSFIHNDVLSVEFGGHTIISSVEDVPLMEFNGHQFPPQRMCFKRSLVDQISFIKDVLLVEFGGQQDFISLVLLLFFFSKESTWGN